MGEDIRQELVRLQGGLKAAAEVGAATAAASPPPPEADKSWTSELEEVSIVEEQTTLFYQIHTSTIFR